MERYMKKYFITLVIITVLFISGITFIVARSGEHYYDSPYFSVRTSIANGNEPDFEITYIDQDEYILSFQDPEYDISGWPTHWFPCLTIWGHTCTGTCYQSCDGTCFPHQGTTCDHTPSSSTCEGTCDIDTCEGFATCDLTCPGDGHTCWCIHETCDNTGFCTGANNQYHNQLEYDQEAIY